MITCPNCGGSNIRRSRVRHLHEWIAKRVLWFDVQRCRNCDWRGLTARRLKRSALVSTLKMTLVVVLGAIVIAFVLTSDKMPRYMEALGLHRGDESRTLTPQMQQ
jgi:hypothetical protein